MLLALADSASKPLKALNLGNAQPLKGGGRETRRAAADTPMENRGIAGGLGLGGWFFKGFRALVYSRVEGSRSYEPSRSLGL